MLDGKHNSNNNNNLKGSEFISVNTAAKISTRIQSTLPLKNITTIRSSSFRNRNLTNQQKFELNSNPTSNNNINNNSTIYNNIPITNAANNNPINAKVVAQMIDPNNAMKTKSSRSFENINNMMKVNTNTNNSDEQTQPSIHRLIKMATSWNGSKSRSDSSTSNNVFKYPKLNETSLISQSKIRQTQMFLNEENKCINNCESVLSRKIADYNDNKSNPNRITTNNTNRDDDENSEKINTNRSRTPIRILPITSRMTFGSIADSKKSNSSEIMNDNNNSNNKNTANNNFWSTNVTNSASEISENSIKESSITNYLSRKNATSKSFNLVHINRNLSAIKLNSSTLPIQIQ